MNHKKYKFQFQKNEKNESRQERIICSPYYYPNFSRYNYPSKIGGDKEKYTEQSFSFPRFLDEEEDTFNVEDYLDYFNNNLSNNDRIEPNNADDDNDNDESEAVCEKIQSDIDSLRKDLKTDFDKFRKDFATIHDEIRTMRDRIVAERSVTHYRRNLDICDTCVICDICNRYL
jgi:hypothetical protein